MLITHLIYLFYLNLEGSLYRIVSTFLLSIFGTSAGWICITQGWLGLLAGSGGVIIPLVGVGLTCISTARSWIPTGWATSGP